MKSNKFFTLWLAGIIIVVFAIQNLFSIDLAWKVGSFHINFFLSMIAHGSMQHLLGNLFALGVFGLILENTVGTRKYIIVLLSAGILGNLAGIGSYDRVLGISGAIYGVFGALSVLRPKMVVWASGMPMPMILAAAGWAFVDFIGLFANTQTGHLAHLAGIVAGIFLGFIWRREHEEHKKPKRKKRLSKTEKEHIDTALDYWERENMR